MVFAHVLCSLLSYVAFLTSFVAGILFLIQERQLKRKTLGVLFHRLPSLEVLDRIHFISVGVGFGLLSVGVVFGFIGLEQLFGRWWTGDPKEVLTILLWLTYLVLWLTRLRTALRGHRVMLFSLLMFGFVVFSFLGASWMLASGHPYL